MSIRPGGGNRIVDYPDPSRPPFDYPINPVTGVSRYMTAMQVTPPVNNCDPTRLTALSAGGMLTLMVDGSARSVAPSVNFNTLAKAFTPGDGFPLPSDWD
jgi:hypothetical protein